MSDMIEAWKVSAIYFRLININNDKKIVPFYTKRS